MSKDTIKRVYICRGLPGAGKSHKTSLMVEEMRQNGESVFVASSDHFFSCSKCGSYNFRLDRLKYAHSWCREQFEKALRAGTQNVFVDNTNVSVRECAAYVRMAQLYDYEVHFVEPSTPWAFDLDELERRNQHGVPREALERMLSRWVPDMTVEKALGPQAGGVMHEDEKAAFPEVGA